MLHTIISINDIYYNYKKENVNNELKCVNQMSTNPFDYLEFISIDNSFNKGENIDGSIKCNFYGNYSSNNSYISD